MKLQSSGVWYREDWYLGTTYIPSFMVCALRFLLCWCWGFMPSGLSHYIAELLIPDILKELVSLLLSIRTQKTWVLNLHGLHIRFGLSVQLWEPPVILDTLVLSELWYVAKHKKFNYKLAFMVLIMNAISWSWSALITTMNYTITFIRTNFWIVLLFDMSACVFIIQFLVLFFS